MRFGLSQDRLRLFLRDSRCLRNSLSRLTHIGEHGAERDLGIKPLKEYAEFLEYVGVVERVLRADEAVYVAP